MPYNETVRLGNGQYISEYKATCRNCQGEGTLLPPTELMHVCDYIKCPVCRGSGQVQIVKHVSITITPYSQPKTTHQQ